MPQKTTMCSLDAISSVSRCMERNQGGCAVVVSNSTATFGVCLISRGRRHRLAGDVSPLKSFGKSAAVLNRELEIELAMHFLGVVKNEVSVVSIILCVASGFKPTSALDNLAKALMQHAEKYETAANLLHQHAKIASVGCELYSAFCVMQNKSCDDSINQTLKALGISLQKDVEPINQAV